MAFEFLPILEQYRIDHRLYGQDKSVHRNNVGIRCPFCPDDDGYHLGISLENGFWNCWKDPTHKGKRPERLLVALLRITYEEAHALVTSGATTLGYDALKEKAAKLFSKKEAKMNQIEPVAMPEAFKELREDGLRARFWKYLRGRGYSDEDLPGFIKHSRLRCCLAGDFAHRIILPFYFRKELVGWTGRLIMKSDAEPKYKTFPATSAPKQILYGYDRAAKGGRALLIEEGPLDAARTSYYGKAFGIRAVALMGVVASPEQITLLLDLAYRFDDIWIALDRDAISKAFFLQSQLALLRPRISLIPEGFKDPGALPPNLIPQLAGLKERRKRPSEPPEPPEWPPSPPAPPEAS